MAQKFYQKASVQVSIVSGIALIIATLITVAHQRSELKRENKSLKQEIEDVKRERDKFEVQLAPFLAAANRGFPDAPPDARLDLLMNKLDEVATVEKQEKMLAMLERMQCFKTTEHEILSRKYPEGYYLFASDKYTVIPSDPKIKSKISLDWEHSKVKVIDDVSVGILLKRMYYSPIDCSVEDLSVFLERKIGATACGIFFDKVGLCIELLDNRSDEIVYVIGFRKVESVPSRVVHVMVKHFKMEKVIMSSSPTLETKILHP